MNSTKFKEFWKGEKDANGIKTIQHLNKTKDRI